MQPSHSKTLTRKFSFKLQHGISFSTVNGWEKKFCDTFFFCTVYNVRNILLKFSGLLRYQLYDCSEDSISLEKEIEYIRNYISFQQIRKQEDLVVNVQIDAAGAPYKIAPLLLVVLLENAFKFVSSFTDRDNKIDIDLTVIDNHFTFRVSNTTEHRQALKAILNPGGIGIVNLKRRLELLYPDKYEIAFKQEVDFYEATLKLELA